MFSHEERCFYRRNPIGEVICQLRFPEILSISAQPPVEFQEAIRADFPQYLCKHENPAPRITGTPGHLTLENAPSTVNYQFASSDGAWRVNLTGKFISLSCTRYDSWEEFARQLDKPLAAFIRIYSPAYFERIGLRYLNFISRRALGLEGVPFRELIVPCYLGPLAEDELPENAASRCSVDLETALRGGCRVKLHAGPGLLRQKGGEDKEVKFVFDQDLFMPGQVSVNLTTGALQTLHAQADSLFRGAITQQLHEAMEPM